jgi:3-dehydroquinate synthetase
LGHALEASGGYTGLTHGEAVSLGLVAALRLGEQKGHTPPELTGRVLALLKRLRLPHVLLRRDLEQCTGLLGHDKKRAGSKIRFVYVSAPGAVFTESIDLVDLAARAPSLSDD